MRCIIRFSLGLAMLGMALAAQAQPQRGFGGGIAGLMPLMSTLDADGDGDISAAEIDAAAAELLSLDADGSGALEAVELTPPGMGAGRFGRSGINTQNLFGLFPVVVAIDKDANGVLSASELGAAGESLLTLDADGNGRLTDTEVLPSGLPFGRMAQGGRGRFGGGFNFGEAPSGPPPEPTEIAFQDGVASIDSREVFEQLSYQGLDVMIDTQLRNLEFVKFVLLEPTSADSKTYFMNTNTHRAHMMFMGSVGIGGFNPRSNDGSAMMGVLVYQPELAAPNGQKGLYTYEFEPNNAFDYELIQAAYDQVVRHAPIVAGRLAYHPLPAAEGLYRQQEALYEAADLPVFLDDELYADISYLPLNPAEGFGILRSMELTERPGVRDIVIYRALPNEMPRVAGIITAVPQTPLSHVNLRAVQDRVPNAYINGASDNDAITQLIGRYVYFRVAPDGYELKEATAAEVDAHFESLRPAVSQVPVRDLAVTEILPLNAIGFADSVSVGVKAANLAVLGKLDLPETVVPDGFAIPFYFYDDFMKSNGFYQRVRDMRTEPGFAESADRREAALTELRDAIEAADMPAWMMSALADLQSAFPPGRSIRLRSSTNNEDLPGFSGAGLYDSYTHRADEGHLASSVKQVFASLWNYRAYEEREFYRVDHYAAAMGVLVHPNYSDEIANGVAVSDDIVYGELEPFAERRFYVNTQVGEDLVTNPDEFSVPEELLLDAKGNGNDRVIATSNQSAGEPILSVQHRDELRQYLARIDDAFRALYRPVAGQQFAMEIEFKITAEGELSIKQARPWVY